MEKKERGGKREEKKSRGVNEGGRKESRGEGRLKVRMKESLLAAVSTSPGRS